jgi:hypothetical protein
MHRFSFMLEESSTARSTWYSRWLGFDLRSQILLFWKLLAM